MAYDDGEVRQQFSIAFTARLVGGESRTSSESKRVEWVDPDEVDRLPMHPSMRMRLQHGWRTAGRPTSASRRGHRSLGARFEVGRGTRYRSVDGVLRS